MDAGRKQVSFHKKKKKEKEKKKKEREAEKLPAS